MNRNARSDDESLRAQAIAMREQGHGNLAIRAALGLTGWGLTKLLQGHVDPKHVNLANRAKSEHRTRARELRGQGWSYDAIARELEVSKSSLSLWLRDMPKPVTTYPGTPPEDRNMNQEDWEAHCADRSAAYWRTYKETRRQQWGVLSPAAVAEVGELSDRELLLLGAAIYWCEGTKSKPWRPSRRVTFANSDPGLITLFLRYLALLRIDDHQLHFTLSIHESADVAKETRYWAAILDVPLERFRKPNIKRHNPKTVRKRRGDAYHGCLFVGVYRSAELYSRIEDCARAIISPEAASRPRAPKSGGAAVAKE